jgi:hypothetical protein
MDLLGFRDTGIPVKVKVLPAEAFGVPKGVGAQIGLNDRDVAVQPREYNSEGVLSPVEQARRVLAQKRATCSLGV